MRRAYNALMQYGFYTGANRRYKMKQSEIQPTDMKINHFQFEILMDN